MNKIYAIPDIHGRLDLLKQLITCLETHHDLDYSRDKLVFLGDYIDRGPDSLGVLRFLYRLKRKYKKNIIVLPGNHEYLMIDFYNQGWDGGLWYINGGHATIDSFINAGCRTCPKYLLDWLKSRPFYHEEEGFFFSHAPVPAEKHRAPRNKGSKYTQDELTWSCPHNVSEKDYARVHNDGIIGICGHIHALKDRILEPRFYDHYIYADAGCGCHSEAPLVAIEVQTREVIYSIPR